MPIFMNISGPNGIIAGNESNGEWEVLSFQWGLTDQRDTATGLASGRRQHQPVIIVVEFAVDIHLLMAGLSENETFKTVAFYFLNGAGTVYDEVILSNVQLGALEIGSGGDVPTITLAFYYQAIEFTNNSATHNVVYRDTWALPVT